MKRLLAILGYTLVLFVAIACIFGMAFAEGCDGFEFGERFRFEGGILDNPDWEVDDDGVILEAIVREPENDDVEFVEITRYREYLYDLLGYYPDFSDDVEDYVTFYLYKTQLHVDAIVSTNGRIFVPFVGIDEEIIKQNQLYSLTGDLPYYSIFEVDSLDYRIIEVDDNAKRLKLTIESYVDGECGKTFDVTILDYEYDEEWHTYFICRDEFRSLWYQVYRY